MRAEFSFGVLDNAFIFSKITSHSRFVFLIWSSFPAVYVPYFSSFLFLHFTIGLSVSSRRCLVAAQEKFVFAIGLGVKLLLLLFPQVYGPFSPTVPLF